MATDRLSASPDSEALTGDGLTVRHHLVWAQVSSLAFGLAKYLLIKATILFVIFGMMFVTASVFSPDGHVMCATTQDACYCDTTSNTCDRDPLLEAAMNASTSGAVAAFPFTATPSSIACFCDAHCPCDCCSSSESFGKKSECERDCPCAPGSDYVYAECGRSQHTAILFFFSVLVFIFYAGASMHIFYDGDENCFNLFSAMCEKFRPGFFFVSYCWGDSTEIPRRFCKLFPHAVAWYDIVGLTAGSDIKTSCGNAARSASFRFVFLGGKYLHSPNSMFELDIIQEEPGTCVIFRYPDAMVPENLRENLEKKVQELRARGHDVQDLPEQRTGTGASQFLWQLRAECSLLPGTVTWMMKEFFFGRHRHVFRSQILDHRNVPNAQSLRWNLIGRTLSVCSLHDLTSYSVAASLAAVVITDMCMLPAVLPVWKSVVLCLLLAVALPFTVPFVSSLRRGYYPFYDPGSTAYGMAITMVKLQLVDSAPVPIFFPDQYKVLADQMAFKCLVDQGVFTVASDPSSSLYQLVSVYDDEEAGPAVQQSRLLCVMDGAFEDLPAHIREKYKNSLMVKRSELQVYHLCKLLLSSEFGVLLPGEVDTPSRTNEIPEESSRMVFHGPLFAAIYIFLVVFLLNPESRSYDPENQQYGPFACVYDYVDAASSGWVGAGAGSGSGFEEVNFNLETCWSGFHTYCTD